MVGSATRGPKLRQCLSHQDGHGGIWGWLLVPGVFSSWELSELHSPRVSFPLCVFQIITPR